MYVYLCVSLYIDRYPVASTIPAHCRLCRFAAGSRAPAAQVLGKLPTCSQACIYDRCWLLSWVFGLSSGRCKTWRRDAECAPMQVLTLESNPFTKGSPLRCSKQGVTILVQGEQVRKIFER